MAPVAAAVYANIAAAAVLALIVGALAGAIAWALKGRYSVLWAGLVAAGLYLADLVVLGSTRLAAAAVIGLPPLVLALLTSWLTARYLDARTRLRRIWVMLIAPACALLVGFLWLLLFRLDLWLPLVVALVADACLIALAYWTRPKERSLL